MIDTLAWTGSALRLLDQTKLPGETVYVDITDERQMHDAIRRLVVRGAPAIGVAAAFGVYLGVRDITEYSEFNGRLDEVCGFLATSRPTAVNLFWAIDRIKRVAGEGPQIRVTPTQLVQICKKEILDECLAMIEEDHRVNRSMGEHGLKLLDQICNLKSQISDPLNILTHCNAGGLATVGYGCGLAPVYAGHERGRRYHVFVDETRPLMQGSRLTAYELKRNDIPATLICDTMTASVLSQGKVDAVIVGADRIALNGDTANKIGTLGVAILARHFGVPFFVSAPTSTIDRSAKTGADIPIEERDASEVTRFAGTQTAPEGVNVYNPAFDVTPAGLITSIITEHGAATPPGMETIGKLLSFK